MIWRKLTLRKKIQTDVNGSRGGGGRWGGEETRGRGGGNQTKAIKFVDRCSTISISYSICLLNGARVTISGGERQKIWILQEVKTGSDGRNPFEICRRRAILKLRDYEMMRAMVGDGWGNEGEVRREE